MGPDYKRLETSASDSWRMQPATTEWIADTAWWDLLKDPELRTAVASVDQYRAQMVITHWNLDHRWALAGTPFSFKPRAARRRCQPEGRLPSCFRPRRGQEAAARRFQTKVVLPISMGNRPVGGGFGAPSNRLKLSFRARRKPAGRHLESGWKGQRSLLRLALIGP